MFDIKQGAHLCGVILRKGQSMLREEDGFILTKCIPP